MTNDKNRLEKLDSILALLDSPKEGDKITFTLVGSPIKYRGVIRKRTMITNASTYQIDSETRSPKGTIDTIEYKGRIFHTGGWKKL